MVQQPLSGIRTSTPDNLVFDAGVIYANIDLAALENPTGGWEDAIVGATAIGATRESAVFNANRELREVEVNGTLGPTKGLTYRDTIRPTLTATMIEMTTANLQMMVAGAISEDTGKFDRISGAEIQEADYLTNIALAATIKGSSQPVVFVLMNVLVHTSPELEFEDHSELDAEVEFVGHFPLDNTRDEVECWRVYRPNEES